MRLSVVREPGRSRVLAVLTVSTPSVQYADLILRIVQNLPDAQLRPGPACPGPVASAADDATAVLEPGIAQREASEFVGDLLDAVWKSGTVSGRHRKSDNRRRSDGRQIVRRVGDSTEPKASSDMPERPDRDIRITLRLPVELHSATADLAIAEDRSLSALTRVALRHYLDGRARENEPLGGGRRAATGSGGGQPAQPEVAR